MTRDYKKSDRRAGDRRSGHSLFVGILIGLILGLGIALGVAWYINKMPSPFLARSAPAKTPPQAAAGSAGEDKAAALREDKPRFDFYRILPGSDEAVPPPQAKEMPKGPTARESFFLQAGAFQNASEADNLKAQLALLGIEATVQSSSAPGKDAVHRVRIGPYTSVDAVNRVRDTLKQNGVETTLVKARDGGAR